ncbi:MAG: glycosyl hydrolase family 65 protein [bacterium]
MKKKQKQDDLTNIIEECRENLRTGKPLNKILSGEIEKKLREKYSHFLDNYNDEGFLINSRHIVKTPETPRPYLHLLSSLHDNPAQIYGSFWSNTGSGFSFVDSIRAGQIISHTDRSYVPTFPNLDDTRTFIIRDNNNKGPFTDENGKNFNAWHAIPQNGNSTQYTCEQAITHIKTINIVEDIQASISVHVSCNDPLEFWQIQLLNRSKKKRDLQLFCKVNWDIRSYPCYYNDQRVTSMGQHFPKINALAAYNLDRKNKNPRAAFIMSDLSPSSWDLSREAFDGPGVRQLWPKSVIQGKCFNSKGEQPFGGLIGAFCFDISLNPGADSTVNILIGKSSPDISKCQHEITGFRKRYFSKKGIAAEIKNINEKWDKLISRNLIKTPDLEFNRFNNVWFKHQARNTSRFTRALEMVGYRDILQDLIGIMDFNIEWVRPILLRTINFQLRDGRAPRQYCLFPDCEHDERMYMDSSIWMVDTVSSYIKETGDIDILDEKVGFYDSHRKILDNTKPVTILDHCFIMIKCLYELRGRFGLCKIGYGDWNDAIDGLGRGGSGVSVWLSHALIHATLLFREMALLKNDTKRIKYLDEIVENMTSNINNYGWEKNHYIYAFNDDGEPVGSNKSPEGKIHLNSNSWALFNNVAALKNYEPCLLKTVEGLNTSLGYMLISPPYTWAKSSGVGRISDIIPGLFENGSIYTHGHAFMIYALAKIGMGGQAYRELKKIFPSATLPDISTAPLHQIPNTIAGTSHPKFGTHFYSNFTGGLSWIKRAAQLMLGVIPEFEGLRIAPCIPAEWDKYRVKRQFRGSYYDIKVENPGHLEKGVKSVSINKKELPPNKQGEFIIKPVKSSKPIDVQVLMG